MAGIPGAARRDHHCGHPLRDPLVQARHRVARGIGGHAAGPCRVRGAVCNGILRRRLHHEPAGRRALLEQAAWPAEANPLAYICGPTSFVETAAAALVGLGYPPGRVKTERFGGTGGHLWMQ
jgi:hypothetical protein